MQNVTIGDLQTTHVTVFTANVVKMIQALLWKPANWSSHCAKIAFGLSVIAWSRDQW